MRYSSAARMRFYHRFHVVWVTKYHYKVLQGRMREQIREIIMQTCAEMGVYIVRDVPGREHVHMYLSISPKLTLSNVTQYLELHASK